jgi:hypothetical protein
VTSPGSGLSRWARAGLLALVTVLISIGGHVLAGGTVHLSTPLLLGAAALGALCVAAADVRRSFGEIFAVVLLAQPVLHLLSVMGAHGSHAGSEAPVGTSMVLAHVAASLVASVLLADAERAFWTMAGLLLPVRIPTPTVACRCALPRVSPHDPTPTPLFSTWHAGTLWRRGPPVVALAP